MCGYETDGAGVPDLSESTDSDCPVCGGYFGRHFLSCIVASTNEGYANGVPIPEEYKEEEIIPNIGFA